MRILWIPPKEPDFPKQYDKNSCSAISVTGRKCLNSAIICRWTSLSGLKRTNPPLFLPFRFCFALLHEGSRVPSLEGGSWSPLEETSVCFFPHAACRDIRPEHVIDGFPHEHVSIHQEKPLVLVPGTANNLQVCIFEYTPSNLANLDPFKLSGTLA